MRVALVTVVGAVRTTVEELEKDGKVLPADTALVKLAEVLAQQIDLAGNVTESLERASTMLREIQERPEVYGTAERLEQVVDRLIATNNASKVLTDVGRRLHDVLESLGAGAKARAAIKGVPAAPPAEPARPAEAAGTVPANVVPESKLASMRERFGPA